MSERKIIEYCIVSDFIISNINQKIEFAFKEGWEILGTPFSWQSYEQAERICQAMVKYENN
ncbi:MAG TPA: hypothetical protein VFG24_03535 [Nitrosopumilaceae archaeon]|nr:hypothetical protein [Nitrosopumilaceae archaeon]